MSRKRHVRTKNKRHVSSGFTNTPRVQRHPVLKPMRYMVTVDTQKEATRTRASRLQIKLLTKLALKQHADLHRKPNKGTQHIFNAPLLAIEGVDHESTSMRCDKMVYRHRAVLLIMRRRSGFFPRRYRHRRWSAGQSAGRVWKRRSKQRRETRRDKQRTLKHTSWMT